LDKVKLRYEWDWKGAERELRRANELKTDYPAAHQWHAAYVFARDFYLSANDEGTDEHVRSFEDPLRTRRSLSIGTTISERVQVFCTVAREQIDSGNYDAACEVLRPWWRWGQRPVLSGLRPESCADLLLTTGALAGCVASARQIPQGQKHGEALLNGAIALFESLGAKGCVAEAQIELALCYYRQGLFELGRKTFESTLLGLSEDDRELRSLCLIRLASLERHAGRPRDALLRLKQAEQLAGLSGPWATGRCHLEYASTYKDLAEIESTTFYDSALRCYQEGLNEFEAIGNHRLAAISENNLGYMLISLKQLDGAEIHLLRAQRVFQSFRDRVLCAQVNDSLARLYLVLGNLELANDASTQAVRVLEEGDEDALLADALSTQGTILAARCRQREGKAILERAYRIAERCGDLEGASRALLLVVNEMFDSCDADEQKELQFRITNLLATGPRLVSRKRLEKAAARVASYPHKDC
jgi:tetratricopeptide (TPR) repeat protein